MEEVKLIFWTKKATKQSPLSPAILNLKKQLTKELAQPPGKLTVNEESIVKSIQEKTAIYNKNNVTRTKAYLDYYVKHKEVHWAFLAHMVSRNGGYNMTDLRGEFLEVLLTENEKMNFFSFLERANWLIFQDAFPQLLLYEECINRQENLFHLLPALHVSCFMKAVWTLFWENHDSSLLTLALIVNEQQYIESMMMQDSFYQKNVLQSLEFLLQDVLSCNHILFPLKRNGEIQLTGFTVHHFENLEERIKTGRTLYSILFSDVLEDTLLWAIATPHTGSRKDYWPHCFHPLREGGLWPDFLPRWQNCTIQKGTARFYSPLLCYAWKDSNQNEVFHKDWCTDLSSLPYLQYAQTFEPGLILSDYCQTVQRLELVTLAKKQLWAKKSQTPL